MSVADKGFNATLEWSTYHVFLQISILLFYYHTREECIYFKPLTFPALSSHFDCSNLDSNDSNISRPKDIILKQKICLLLLCSLILPPRRSITTLGLPLGCEDGKINIREPQRTQNRLFQIATPLPATSLTLRQQASCTESSGLFPCS